MDTKSLDRDDRSRYSFLMKKCTSPWFCQVQQEPDASASGRVGVGVILAGVTVLQHVAHTSTDDQDETLLFCASMLLSRVYRFQNWLEETQKVSRGDWAPKFSITDRGRSVNKVRGRMSWSVPLQPPTRPPLHGPNFATRSLSIRLFKAANSSRAVVGTDGLLAKLEDGLIELTLPLPERVNACNKRQLRDPWRSAEELDCQADEDVVACPLTDSMLKIRLPRR